MDRSIYQEFMRVVDEHAADTFRSAWTYDSNDWYALYVREDIATDDLRNTVATLAQRAREQEPIAPSEIYGKMGEVEAMIELHTDAVILHFREAPTRGVIITFDQDAARDLAGFVDQCNSVLQ